MDPLVDQSCILSPAQAIDVAAATGKGVVVEPAAAVLQPRQDTGPCSLKQFKLDGPSGLLLHDCRPGSYPAAADEIADPHLNHVTTRSLLSMARSKRARSRNHPSRSSQNLIPQTCRGLSGRLAPGSQTDCPMTSSPRQPLSAGGIGTAAVQETKGEWVAFCRSAYRPVFYKSRHSRMRRDLAGSRRRRSGPGGLSGVIARSAHRSIHDDHDASILWLAHSGDGGQ
jgi:hypothetical protein